jgi:hypothetical protein
VCGTQSLYDLYGWGWSIFGQFGWFVHYSLTSISISLMNRSSEETYYLSPTRLSILDSWIGQARWRGEREQGSDHQSRVWLTVHGDPHIIFSLSCLVSAASCFSLLIPARQGDIGDRALLLPLSISTSLQTVLRHRSRSKIQPLVGPKRGYLLQEASRTSKGQRRRSGIFRSTCPSGSRDL